DVLAAARVTNGLGRKKAGRRIAYLGDMKELGPNEAALHADLAGHPAMQAIDVVHCTGPLMRSLHEALPSQKRGRWTKTAKAMAGHILRDLDAGDVVMVKGSLSMGLSRVVDVVRAMGHPRGDSGPDEEL
ncbi:MAG: glutamate ligase domain-containing protein, partial [Paracoccaceae bacterium]